MIIDVITRYSLYTYFNLFQLPDIVDFGTGCIVRNGEWDISVNYSVSSSLFPMKLRVLFEEGKLGTPVQKDAVPIMII